MTIPPDPTPGFSRRSFLKGSAAATVAGASLRAAADATARTDEPPSFGPGEHEIVLNVNGKDLKVTVETRTTLLDALRDHLDLTGTKRVCDRGSCGACTVHLDGLPVNSCLTLAMDAVGHRVTTIESLTEGEKVHPLVQEFVHCDAMQCGFCTPGMVMSGLACLHKHGKPTHDQMAHELSGNLCRCGTYGRVMQAIENTANGGAR